MGSVRRLHNRRQKEKLHSLSSSEDWDGKQRGVKECIEFIPLDEEEDEGEISESHLRVSDDEYLPEKNSLASSNGESEPVDYDEIDDNSDYDCEIPIPSSTPPPPPPSEQPFSSRPSRSCKTLAETRIKSQMTVERKYLRRRVPTSGKPFKEGWDDHYQGRCDGEYADHHRHSEHKDKGGGGGEEEEEESVSPCISPISTAATPPMIPEEDPAALQQEQQGYGGPDGSDDNNDEEEEEAAEQQEEPVSPDGGAPTTTSGTAATPSPSLSIPEQNAPALQQQQQQQQQHQVDSHGQEETTGYQPFSHDDDNNDNEEEEEEDKSPVRAPITTAAPPPLIIPDEIRIIRNPAEFSLPNIRDQYAMINRRNDPGQYLGLHIMIDNGFARGKWRDLVVGDYMYS